MKTRRTLVTPERAAKLEAFAKDLAALCNRYDVDLDPPDELPGFLCIVERSFYYPEGYYFSACINGCDVDGAYHHVRRNGEFIAKPGLEIAEIEE